MVGDDSIAIRWMAVGDGEEGGEWKAVRREEKVGRKRRGKPWQTAGIDLLPSAGSRLAVLELECIPRYVLGGPTLVPQASTLTGSWSILGISSGDCHLFIDWDNKTASIHRSSSIDNNDVQSLYHLQVITH